MRNRLSGQLVILVLAASLVQAQSGTTTANYCASNTAGSECSYLPDWIKIDQHDVKFFGDEIEQCKRLGLSSCIYDDAYRASVHSLAEHEALFREKCGRAKEFGCQQTEIPKVPCNAVATSTNLRGRTVPVKVVTGALLFSGGMEIDADGSPNAYGPNNTGLDYTANAKNGTKWVGVMTDGKGDPIIQQSGPYKGFYISTTTLQKRVTPADPSSYVDATTIPFIALPPAFIRQFGVSVGDFAVVTNAANGKTAYAIFADVGPTNKIGEGSIALAQSLGITSDPRRGGVTKGISYIVFPKTGLGQGKLRTVDEINSGASALFQKWGGQQRIEACANSLQ